MNASYDEPTIPLWLRRPLVAVWISLGLHAALIALVQVAPPPVSGLEGPMIEARLVPTHAASLAVVEADPVALEENGPAPVLVPSETAEALSVAKPAIQPEPIATPKQPVVAVPTESRPAPAESSPPPRQSASALSITSAVDLTYYSARDVDVHPGALQEVEPVYPADADRQRLSGKVVLQLKIETDGRVSSVEVVSASPPGRFEDSAKQAFIDARFSPAQKKGRPVRALVLIEVQYDWKGRAR